MKDRRGSIRLCHNGNLRPVIPGSLGTQAAFERENQLINNDPIFIPIRVG